MKMQTKPFVVEHKSHRRHERHDGKSIWAGVDLAAVTDDVGDDLPTAQDDRHNRDEVYRR